MTLPRLYLSHDADYDWLIALEFGRVDDGQPPDAWRGVTEQLGFLHEPPGGRVVGFKVIDVSSFDVEDSEAAEIRRAPRFDVPVVGLTNACVGEIVLAVRSFFGDRDSLNRMLFGAATRATGEEAVELWSQCLESGDPMAHFALGYTLFELGRHAEAYRHLRHYAEIAPHGAWNWCWYGYAAEAVGEPAEARRAYRRAMELEQDGSHETDDAERLANVTAAVRPVPAADRIRGCFLGGAVGDALGAPVEFERIEGIRGRFGVAGIAELDEAGERPGAITDDTQMTLFTAEGLIRARIRADAEGSIDVPAEVDRAYVRWLATQGEPSDRPAAPDGWLAGVRGLHERCSPGTTCTSALRGPRAGTVDAPLNDSKGCGGVMRMAPAGLMGARYRDDRFDLGCDLAALTHGHPCGYLAAGALAELVGRLADGEALESALDHVERRLAERPRHEETLAAVRAARALATGGAEPSAETVATLGLGWVAEEALAIAVYCALVAEDFAHGVRLAVNHSGDSDSTGAIAGSILGVRLGAGAVPAHWIAQLELRAEIERLIADWLVCFGPEAAADLATAEWSRRYPGACADDRDSRRRP